MKQFFIFIYVLFIVFIVIGDVNVSYARGGRGSRGGGSVSVKGYTRKDGTYVQPHNRSAPDGRFNNNWSTKGNVNPYTGKEGTKTTPPDSNSQLLERASKAGSDNGNSGTSSSRPSTEQNSKSSDQLP
jgi:hypothetical protein